MNEKMSSQVAARIKSIGVVILLLLLAGSSFFFGFVFFKVNAKLDQCNKDLIQAKAELAALTDYANTTAQDVFARKENIEECVEPYIPLIRDTAVAIVANSQSGIKSNSESWKIWQINYWAAHNINYIADPKGQNYYALASETMLTRGGDCDDYAILIASMYESVGLDACICFVDTNSDNVVDHMSCLVYFSKDPATFLDEEEEIMDKLMLKSPTGKSGVANFKAATFEKLPKYDSGTWIVVDPLAGFVNDMAGYIIHEEYGVMRVIDAGN